MEIPAFAIACVALIISAISFGWQVFTWRRSQRFDVNVRLGSWVPLDARTYEVTVTVENQGATHEAVQSIVLSTLEHQVNSEELVDGRELKVGRYYVRLTGPPAFVHNFAAGEGVLPPRRNVRAAFDLFPFYAQIPVQRLPTAVVADVRLETGERIVSEEHETPRSSFAKAGLPSARDEPEPGVSSP